MSGNHSALAPAHLPQCLWDSAREAQLRQVALTLPLPHSQHLPFKAGRAWRVKGLAKEAMPFSCLAQKIPETVLVLPRKGQEFIFAWDVETHEQPLCIIL